MTTYLLIHGGHNDGSVWDIVSAILRRKGHTVIAPTLADPQTTTLTGHISEITGLIEEQDLTEIILVGHSYGSMVITGTFDRLPGRIRRLVYLDAAVPQNGDSLYGIMERCGVRYQDADLPADAPFIEPLFFDEERIRQVNKTYLHCTKSEFLAVGLCTYTKIKSVADRDHWDCYELASPHNCMKAFPEEVAAILLGRD